jgi:hypothetical protein
MSPETASYIKAWRIISFFGRLSMFFELDQPAIATPSLHIQRLLIWLVPGRPQLPDLPAVRERIVVAYLHDNRLSFIVTSGAVGSCKLQSVN